MDNLDASQTTDVPVTLKFMQDMDAHLSGKAKEQMDNIFTVLGKIPRQQKMSNIEELESKKIEEFPIKVLMAPDILTYFNKYELPTSEEFISLRLLVLAQTLVN